MGYIYFRFLTTEVIASPLARCPCDKVPFSTYLKRSYALNPYINGDNNSRNHKKISQEGTQ